MVVEQDADNSADQESEESKQDAALLNPLRPKTISGGVWYMVRDLNGHNYATIQLQEPVCKHEDCQLFS